MAVDRSALRAWRCVLGISQADEHIPNLLPCVEQAFGFELFDPLCGKAGRVVEVSSRARSHPRAPMRAGKPGHI
jgi:hypothetical protein